MHQKLEHQLHQQPQILIVTIVAVVIQTIVIIMDNTQALQIQLVMSQVILQQIVNQQQLIIMLSIKRHRMLIEMSNNLRMSSQNWQTRSIVDI